MKKYYLTVNQFILIYVQEIYFQKERKENIFTNLGLPEQQLYLP